MDGLPAGPGYGNYNESAPAVDAIREFRLITSQMAPEYGASGAGHREFFDCERDRSVVTAIFTSICATASSMRRVFFHACSLRSS